MTQVEKEVRELYEKYYRIIQSPYAKHTTTKRCALMEVNAIIKVLYSLKFGNALSEKIEHYEKLKEEIEKL